MLVWNVDIDGSNVYTLKTKVAWLEHIPVRIHRTLSYIYIFGNDGYS